MIKKIFSGGLTGADRAGLDAGKFLKIPTGGYCPKGFLTETGYDLSLKSYGLVETESGIYEERTMKNVLSCDGTVIFCNEDAEGNIIGLGTAFTHQLCLQYKKPVIKNPSAKQFIEWIKKNKIRILNVAGNRESQSPGIYNRTKKFLIKNLKN